MYTEHNLLSWKIQFNAFHSHVELFLQISLFFTLVERREERMNGVINDKNKLASKPYIYNGLKKRDIKRKHSTLSVLTTV